MSNHDEYANSSTSIFGWKGVIAACIFGVIFMGILYMTVSNEPDYMPSQQHKKMQQTEQTQNQDAHQGHHGH